MATSNTSLRVAELDFFRIKDNLKNYLRSQSTFTDYDFEGSGLNVLLDVLAYNTYYNSFYLNMIANESFLDTAQIRKNVLSHAKLINYVPGSAQGALAKVNVTVTPSLAEDQTLTTLTLDRYTRIIGQDVDGVNYSFVTINANTAAKVSGSYSFSNVFIKQGEVITQQFLVDANNTFRKFELPSANIDTSSLIVTVQASSANTYTDQYFEISDITTVDANSRVYFLEENENLNYNLFFGDGILGKKPDVGSIVIATYLDTVGGSSNNISKFTFVEPIGTKFKDNVRISTITGSYSGVNKESVDDIRFRAPFYYTAQNRAVNVSDYESLLIKDYPNVDAVTVWGGENNDPVVYGKVYMSIKTKGFYQLTELEKERIKTSLIQNRNVLTIVPEIVDPSYNFLQVRGRVTYDPTLTTKNSTEILALIKNAVEQYNIDELNGFKSTYKRSLLQNYIEASEPSITSSDIYVFLQNRLYVTYGQTKNYELKFNTPLRKGDYARKLYTFPQAIVQDAAGIIRNVFFEEVPNSFTGVDSINITNSGRNYTSSPTITITGDGTGATAQATVVNGRIRSIEVTNKGINYSQATVTITDSDGIEATAVPVLQGKIGELRTYYYKTNGEKIFVSENAGSINYETGKIILSSFDPLNMVASEYYDENILTVNVVPENQVIPPLRNRILAIDSSNPQSIQIELVPET